MTLHDKAVEAAQMERYRLPGCADTQTIIRAYLAACAAAGWKLTPREATEDMMFAGHEAARSAQVSGISGMTIDAQLRNKAAREIAAWSAMHDAAPSPEEAHER